LKPLSVQINNVDIHYLIIESSTQNAETLVLLHGLGSSSLDWEYQYQPLSEKYRLVIPDIRGHGKSSLDGKFSIELFAKDIQLLMQQLGIEQYHVAGLSMGGAIAFQLAIENQAALKSLIVINSAPGFAKSSALIWFKIQMRRVILRLFGLKAVAPKIAKGLFPNGSNPELSQQFTQRFGNNNKQAYLKSMKALLNWDIYARLGEIKCPTLILAAENDYFSIESKIAYSEQIPHAKLQVIGATHHALPVEDPVACNQAIIEFIEQPFS